MQRALMVLASIMTLCFLTCTAQAALICYEGAGYAPTNNANGLSGSGDSGFNGPWVFNAGPNKLQVMEPGMSYASPAGPATSLATNVNRMAHTCTADWENGYRMLDTADPALAHLRDGAGFYGKAGSTNWITVLMRYESPTNNIGVHQIVLNNNPSFATHGIEFGTHLWVDPTHWHLHQHGGPQAACPELVVPQQTILFAMRLLFGPDGGSADSAQVWINPVLTNEPRLSDVSVVLNNLSDIYYDRIGVGGYPAGSTSSFDEIRIGEFWSDVAPLKPSSVGQPVNISPASGALGVALTPTLQASVFTSSAPGDVHTKSQFSIRSDNGANWNVETNARVQIQVPADILEPATRYTWKVRYLGTDSDKWGNWSVETTFETEYASTPQLIAYDGAAYDATSGGIHNYNGGFGWAAPWEQVGIISHWTRVHVGSPGLMYQFTAPVDYLMVTNNKFLLDQNGADWGGGQVDSALSRAMRKLGTDRGMHLITLSNTYGKAGTTNWFSFLAKYESGDTASRYGVDLNLENTGNAPYFFFIGKPAGQDNWGMAANGGSVSAVSVVSAIDGTPALLVCRVIYGADTETASLWVNPTSRTAPQDVDATVLGSVPNFEFRYLGIVADSSSLAPTIYLDELRFGDGWQTVMPSGPAPPLSVGTPVNVAPANGALNLPLPLTITASAFSGAGAGDLHLATEVQFTTLDGANLTVSTGGMSSLQVPAGLLKNATQYSWIVRYLGTNNPAWSEWSAPTSFTTVQGPPALLSYDGAAYLATTNVVPNRAGGFGWRGAWVATVWNTLPPGTYYYAMVNVGDPGLTYADLVTTSNRFVTSPYGWTYGTWGNTDQMPFSSVRRMLGRDGAMHLLNANDTFGKPGTTNWFSFLACAESGIGTTYGIDLALTNTVNDGGLLTIGCVPGTNAWGLWYPATSLSAASGVNAETGTALLVVRLASGAANDTAHLWVNPLLGSQPAEASATVLADFPHIEYQCVDVMSVGTPAPFIGIDEVRMGDSWQSVTPVVPEPHALALLALLAFGARTRRQR